MSLLKVPFLLPQTAGMHRLMTPPNVSSSDECFTPTNWGEWVLHVTWPPIVIKTVLWAAGVCEWAVIAASQHPTSRISQGIMSTLVIGDSPVYIRITPIFSLGTMLIAFGILIRLQAFSSLGPFFTFQLTIRKDHQLITTGPYSIVRHPSYTGMFLAYAGELLCHGSRGSWLRESGILATWLGRLVTGAWVLLAVSIVSSLAMRIAREEDILRKKFGKEWDDWAERVRYKLIPGIY